MEISVDRGRNRLAEDVEALFVLCKLFDVLDVSVVELRLFLLIKQTSDACRDDLGPENAGNHSVDAPAWGCTIDSCNLNTIAWLQFLN